jgi:quinol-cytochrome oxidoreductase complex cytochrome b subunit
VPRHPAIERLAALWADVKASTDASVLSLARFVGLLYGPIDTSLPIDRALRKALAYRLPAHISWRHALGGVTYLLFIVLVATGVLLSFYYRPSVTEALPSLQHILSDVSFGWLIHGLHVWAANALVLVALTHMGRILVETAYLPPRETNWLIGILLLFTVFGFGATGVLLPWDQWAYWTVTEAFDTLERLPLVGAAAVHMLRADPVVSGATLSRFFALHVILLPWIALGLLILHFTLVRKHGVAPPVAPPPATATATPFTHHLLRSLTVAVVVLAVLITLVALFPRAIGDAADPARPPDVFATGWLLVDVSRGLTHYLGPWGPAALAVLALGLALVPLFDRQPERGLRHRPVVAALGVAFFALFALGWGAGWRLRSVTPRAAQPAMQQEPAAPAPDTAAAESGATR